ncbi:MAG: glycoside hydrolase domain-containing protein [Bacteroides cellulosilyticus]
MWDTYRTKYPLLSIVCPTEYKHMISSLAELYKQGKPRSATKAEPFLTTRTEHSIITILDALQKGMFDGSLDELLPLMLKEAEDISNDSPDKALERGYDFWGVSELAGKMVHKELKKSSLYAQKNTDQYGYKNLRTLVQLQI